MTDCEHDLCWSVHANDDSGNCIACLMHYLENDYEPLIYRENLLKEFLSDFKIDFESYSLVLEQDEDIISHLLCVIVTLFHKLNDSDLQSLLCEGCLLLFHKFGNVVVVALSGCISQICVNAGSLRNCLHLFSLLIDLLHHIPLLTDSLLSAGMFVDHVICGIAFPEDKLRLALLDILFKLVSRWIETHESLTLFNDLLPQLFNLMLHSDSHQVLLAVLCLLGECGTSSGFLELLTSLLNMDEQTGNDFTEETNEFKKMFSCIKRIFLLRQDALNLGVVKCLSVILNHGQLFRSFLDADLAELMYDALRASTNHTLILSVYICIELLSESQEFFISCHAMYGITSVSKSLMLVLPGTCAHTTCKGFEVLKSLLDRQPPHIPMLESLSSFDQILQVIIDGIMSKQELVLGHAMAVACSLLNHLPHPAPYRDISSLLHSMEIVLPQYFEAMASSSQAFVENVAENFQIDDQGVYSHLFMFLLKCFRLCLSEESVSNSGPEDRDFYMFLVETLTKRWVPLMKSHTSALYCLPVMENFFSCIAQALQSGHTHTQALWSVLVSDGFVELGLKLKSQCEQLERCSSALLVLCDFLLTITHEFMSLFDCVDSEGILKHGLQNLKGKPSEMLQYLSECAVTSNGQIISDILSTQCAVFGLLAATSWHEKCFVPLESLFKCLKGHVSMHPDLSHFPAFSHVFMLFLLSICQQDSAEPQLPTALVDQLLVGNGLLFPHSSVVAVTLQCPDHVIDRNIKSTIISSWISSINNFSFSSHPGSQLLVGLILLNDTVAELILDALARSTDHTQANKLVLLLTGAISESAQYSDEDADLANFSTMLCQRLPDLIELDWERVRQAPASVTASLLDLCHTLVSKQLSDGGFYQHRFLRKMLSLVSNGLDSVDDIIDDLIIMSATNIITVIVDRRTKPGIQTSELAIVLSNSKFLACLQQLLLRPTDSDVCVVHYHVIRLLASLVRLESECQMKAEFCIKLEASKLVCYVQWGYDEQLQSGALLLLSSLFDAKFRTTVFHLQPLAPPSGCLLNHDDVRLAPLNRIAINGLFTFVLNCSVKGLLGIKEASYRCAISMLTFARDIGSDVFRDMTLSPWLEFSLNFNADESPEVTRLSRVINTLIEGNTCDFSIDRESLLQDLLPSRENL